MDFRNGPLGVKPPSDDLATVIVLPSVVDTRAATLCHQMGAGEPISNTGSSLVAGQLSIQRLHRIRVPVAGPREAEACRPRPE